MNRPLETTSDTSAPPSATPHVWERWMLVWHLLFYGLLALATALALSDVAGARRVAIVGLALLLGIWHWAMIVRHPGWAHQRLWPLLAYFAGALALVAALTLLHSAFMFVAGTFYMLFYTLLPLRMATGATVVLMVAMIWQQVNRLELGAQAAGPVIVMVVLTAMSVVLALFIDAVIHQSSQRQQLIEELEAARQGLAVAEHQAGVLAERQRLARDIHDTLAQSFISIVLHLEAFEQALPSGVVPAQRHLDQARRTAREGLAEARRLVWALRPELLERASLSEALSQLAARWSDEAGVSATAATTGTPQPLAPQIEVTLLRAAQEALANVRKHARARQVTLTLSYMGDSIALDVHDDGVGFAPGQLAPDGWPGFGYGLAAMRERVEQLGGTLAVESAPAEGTTLAIELPV